MITLGEIQSDPRIAAVTSSCPTSTEFISLVNKGVRQYVRRGDFSGSVEDIYVCASAGCVVMPRYVAGIRRMNFCNQAVPVENGWWRFMDSSSHNRHWENWRGPDWQTMLQARDRVPVFQDIMGDGRYVRAYPRCQNDINPGVDANGNPTPIPTIRIFGTDNNGQVLMEKDVNGDWQPGITLTLALPFVSSPSPVRHIDYVIRDQTQCPVDCFAYNAATNTLEALAHYEPSETRPDYARYHLSVKFPTCGTGSIQPNCCGTPRGLLFRVKLKFIPAQLPSDILPINNMDAIPLLIQAVKAQESGNFGEFTQWMAAAVKEGNLELNDEVPDEQFAASNNVLGPSVWNNQVF